MAMIGFQFVVHEAMLFFNWVRNHISIILPKDMPDCTFVSYRDFYGLDGELQVRNSIPLKYFIGIGVPTGKSFKRIVSEVKCCAEEYWASERYFKKHLGNYCKSEITPVREILKQCGCDLKLYDIGTVELIPPIEQLCDAIYHNNESLFL